MHLNIQKLKRSLLRFRGDTGLRSANLHAVPVREGYDRWAATYAETDNVVQRKATEWLAVELGDLSGQRVLDFGCGPGRMAPLFLDRGATEIVGVDCSPNMITTAQRAFMAPNTSWHVGDAFSLNPNGENFDLLAAILVFGHVADLRPSLSRVLTCGSDNARAIIIGFHPRAVRAGQQRTFTDPRTGRSVAIEHHGHAISEYVDIARISGFQITSRDEWIYEDMPTLFKLVLARTGCTD